MSLPNVLTQPCKTPGARHKWLFRFNWSETETGTPFGRYRCAVCQQEQLGRAKPGAELRRAGQPWETTP